jgi:hypothetical protein
MHLAMLKMCMHPFGFAIEGRVVSFSSLTRYASAFAKQVSIRRLRSFTILDSCNQIGVRNGQRNSETCSSLRFLVFAKKIGQ